MPIYLLDSDVIINYFAKHQPAVSLIAQISQVEAPATTVLSVVEVKIGVKDAQMPKVERFFNALKIIPLDEEIVNLAVDLIRKFSKKGKVRHLVDACIAATAMVNTMVLVTGNKKDYPMEELKLL